MNTHTRHNPLGSLDDDDDAVPAAATAPKPMLPKEEAQRIAQSFIGGNAQVPAPAAPARKQRRYTTGRNQQFNIKATGETIARANRMADDRNVPLGVLLELALQALDDASKK